MGKVNWDTKTKQCTVCLEIKPLSKFHKLRKSYQPKCAKCRKKYQDRKDKKVEKKTYDRNRLSSTLEIRSKRSRKKLLARYGLDEEGFKNKFKLQNNSCIICGKKEKDSPRTFHIDHDHETGEVRDILCFHCNVGLGNFKDSSSLLMKAVEYLIKWRK